MDHPIRYQPLHAPRTDRQAFIEPPLSSVRELLVSNQADFAEYGDVQIGGQPLSSLRASTQQDLLQAAIAYTSTYRNLPNCCADLDLTTESVSSRSIILSGHQPELFHPGVWFKNFALSVLGQHHQAVPINLVVDSDAMKQTSIAIPTGTVAKPHREYVAFDKSAEELPHEERSVLDSELFSTFGQRAAAAIQPLVKNPLVEEFWPLVKEQTCTDRPLGETLAQARHRLEGAWGLQTLELPQSHVCQLREYHIFTAHLISHYNHLWKFYNTALAEYRQVHHLRTPAQPLPNLTVEDDWHEMPYWCWTKSNPQRRPLFVRSSGNELLLTNRAGWEKRLSYTAEQSAEQMVEQLASLESQGVKLRTRALATTMFARLLLSDLFLHGIGGAKYDQVTDRLIGLLFDLPAPNFLTLTATVKLPIDRPLVEPTDATQMRVQLRDLHFNPERYMQQEALILSGAPAEVQALIAEKQRWIESKQTPQNASTRHFEIRKASTALLNYVEPLRKKLLAEQQQLASQLQAESVLGSREFSFCLYEATTLRAQLLEFLPVTS